MGKGGRGKPKQAAAAAKEDDDALLDAAIAENTQAKMAEKRAQVAHSVAVAQRDQRAKALTKVEICEKLNGLPAFAIVNASKQFVPLRVAGADGNGADGEVAMLWTEPLEAESALAQATRQQPDERLAIGAIPLGRALALCEGWATAEGAARSFRLRAHPKMSEELRPLLTQQLQQRGLPVADVFPVFLCEELSTDACMPVFLSRAEVVATWEQAMQQATAAQRRPPPKNLTVMDLRVLVARMQEEGAMDWSVLRFVGTDRAYEMVKKGQRQQEEEPPPLEE